MNVTLKMASAKLIITMSFLVVVFASTVFADAVVVARSPPNPNVRWVTALVGGFFLAILMSCIMLIISFLVVRARKIQLARVAAMMSSGRAVGYQANDPCLAGGDPTSPLPLLLEAQMSFGLAGAEMVSSTVSPGDRYVYYNKGMEDVDAKMESTRGRDVGTSGIIEIGGKMASLQEVSCA